MFGSGSSGLGLRRMSGSAATMKIVIGESLAGKIAVAAFAQRGVAISRFSPALWSRIGALTEEYRTRFGDTPPGGIEALAAGRNLYKAAGVDPTRRRPASEALLRRILQGKDLYRINSAVDCCNFCSLRYMLPMGLYDAEKIEGDRCEIRLGLAGESYEGHGKELVTLHGQIAAADGAGPFGHPSSDSTRTAVSVSTRNLLWIVFAPYGIQPGELETCVKSCIATVTEHCGGTADRIPDPALEARGI